jgi:pimeloyl-ACP methyl ester carboxylesterase
MRLTLPALGLLLVVAATAPALAVQPTDGYFTAHDGVKIHYLEAGNKNGPGAPVVLIHGYTGTALGNWFTNGIADALIGRHWVVAIDCRGHGQSDKPHDPAKYGPQMAEDVVELMDHLKIEKAHIGGYSMGGFITGQLLAKHPERFITAVFGGSGVPEVEAEWKEKVPTDKKEKDPKEDEASKKLRGIPDRDQEALDAVFRYPWKPGERTNIDLTKIKIPVLAINGEFDKPNAKTHRMQRELVNFKSVVLPGKSHLTAIMPGYIPKEYIDTLAAFIDANDRQP